MHVPEYCWTAAHAYSPPGSREAVTGCHRYLTGHLDRLHYGAALKNGWPIATGAHDEVFPGGGSDQASSAGVSTAWVGMAVAINAVLSARAGSAGAVTVRQAMYPSGRTRAAPAGSRP